MSGKSSDTNIISSSFNSYLDNPISSSSINSIKVETSNKENSDLLDELTTNKDKYSDINSYPTNDGIKQNSQIISETNDYYISSKSSTFENENEIIYNDYSDKSTQKLNTESTIYPNDSQFYDGSNIRASIITNAIKISESISDTNIISTDNNYKNSDLISQSASKSGEKPNSSNINTFDDYSSEFFTESNTEDTSKETKSETTNGTKDSTYFTTETISNENKYSTINSYHIDNTMKESSESISDIKDIYKSSSSSFYNDSSITDSILKDNKFDDSSEIIPSSSNYINNNNTKFNTESIIYPNDGQFSDSSNIKTNDNNIPESISDINTISTNNFKNTDIITSSTFNLDEASTYSSINTIGDVSSEFITESINIGKTAKEEMIEMTNEPENSNYFPKETNKITSEDILDNTDLSLDSTSKKELHENSENISYISDSYYNPETTSFTNDNPIISDSITYIKDNKSYKTSSTESAQDESLKDFYSERLSNSQDNQFSESSNIRTNTLLTNNELSESIYNAYINKISTNNNHKPIDITISSITNLDKELPSSILTQDEEYSSEFFTESSINTDTEVTNNETKVATTGSPKDSSYLASESNSITNEDKFSNSELSIDSTANKEFHENSENISYITDSYYNRESTSFTNDNPVISSEYITNTKDHKFDNISSSIFDSGESSTEFNSETISNSLDNQFPESSNSRTNIIANSNENPETIPNTNIISTYNNYEITNDISSSFSKLDKDISSANIKKDEDYTSDLFPVSSINNEESTTNEPKDSTYFAKESSINTNINSISTAKITEKDEYDSSGIKSDLTDNYKPESPLISISDTNIISNNNNYESSEVFPSSSSKLDKELSS